MTAPAFYIVADGNAYALDDDGTPFGAPVLMDGSVDWDNAYDFDPCEEDLDYVAHISMLLQIQLSQHSHQSHLPIQVHV